MSKINSGFKYIDDDLQNLRQLLNFRVEDVLPRQPLSTPTKIQPELEVITMETRANNDVVLVDHRPLKGMSNVRDPEPVDNVVTSDSTPSEPVVEAKPPFHYSDLIEFALREKEQLTVSEIYDWILQRFPYFKQVDENRWKPAVRHTLTTNSAFYKAKKASRGYLWAYRSPEQRRFDYDELQKKVLGSSKHKSYGTSGVQNHWKKKKIAEYTETPGYMMDNPSLLASGHYYPVSVNVPVSGKMKPTKAYIIAPTKKSTKPNTVVMESSETDSDLDDDSPREKCSCRVEYSQSKDRSYTYGMPCCHEQTAAESGYCTCLNTSYGTPKHARYETSHDSFNNWNPLGSPCVPSVSSARSLWDEFQSSANLGRSTTSAESVDRSNAHKYDSVPLSSYNARDSSQMMYVPCMLASNRSAAMKSNNSSAPLYQVPKEVAIQESGLLEVPHTTTSLGALPTVSNLFPSRTAPCSSLDDIFTLDDYTRCGMSSSFNSNTGLNTSSSSLTI